jgi:hypothetical protein
LEDEVFSLQWRDGWSWFQEEEIPQRGERIYLGFITADVSSTPQSEQEVEEIQGED